MKPMDLLEALGEIPEEYIVRELEYEPPRKRTAFLVSKPFLASVSTAACLLLIVGVGVGVWSRQQRIEPLPPQETQTTTVMQTETKTETTAQITAESQTTGKQTETSKKALESTTISAIVTDRAQPSTSEAALLTTVPNPETTAVATVMQQTSAARQSTPSVLPSHTVLPQTSLPAHISQIAITVTERTAQPKTDSTHPSQTEPAVTSSLVVSTQTEPTEPDVTTDPIEPPPTEPPPTDPPPTDPPPTDPPPTDPTDPWSSDQVPTSPTDPDTKKDVFAGFHVTLGGPLGLDLRITSEPEDDDPDDFSLEYGIDGTDFQSVNAYKDYRHFCILSEDGSREIHFGQKIRKSFYFDYHPNKDEQIFAWGDCPGFVREDPNGWCSCIWDDGNYIMTAGCYREDLPLLKKVHPIAN